MNKSGTYSSQSGHDDVAMTLVNLPALMDGSDFNQMVSDIFDEMEDSVYKDMIIAKLEGELPSDEDMRDFSTKQGQSYKDFSKLL
jgi:hypothetical protein